MRQLTLTAAAIAIVLSGSSFLKAQTSIPTTNRADVLIEYTGPTQLSNDYMVMRIRIVNRTGRDRRWIFEFNAPRLSNADGGRRSRFELEVEGGQDRRFEILVPLAGAPDASWVQMFVYGYGVANPGRMSSFTNTASSTVAVSTGAEIKGEHLHQWLLDHNGPFDPLPFEAGALTRDWRAYASLSVLWLTGEEWREVDPAVRRVLTEWVAGGGRLVLIEEGDTPGPEPIRRHGMGVIGTLPAGLTGDEANRFNAVAAPPNGNQDSLSWAGNLIQPIETHRGLLSLALLGYLVLAGPVNLFVFAGGAKRIRLFWTMPTIALGASVVMAVFILLQDGVGGSGVRVSFVYLLPNLNRELVVQEQVSRTGALLRRNFEIDEPVHITSHGPYPDEAKLFNSGSRYEGDWFRSRSVQAQRIRTARPSRARILVGMEGNRRAIRSSIGARLEELYFRDESGRVWRAENVLPGHPAVFGSATEQEYRRFCTEVSDRVAGPKIRMHIDAIRELPGAFLARAAEGASEAIIETLPNIDWTESPVLYAGHVEEDVR